MERDQRTAVIMMRSMCFGLGLLALLVACGEEENYAYASSENVPAVQGRTDTVAAMKVPMLGTDGVVQEQRVPVGNDSYPLRLTRYDLKDGSANDRAYRIQFDYAQYHLDTVVTKELFADSLRRAEMKEAFLWKCTFDAVRSNSLYFIALINDTRTSAAVAVRFSIFYRGPKFGTMYYLVEPAEG